MNSREVERELTAVLHRHAEDAMNRTDTQQRHDQLQDAIEGRSRRDRRWAMGSAVAAGVAAVAVFAFWSADTGDRPDSGPAGSEQSATEIAQAFAEAAAAGDFERARTYFAPSAMDDWGIEDARYDDAWSREYLLKPCVETSVSNAEATVDCPFDMHVLHSERLGRGPFTDNKFSLTISDGKITSVEDHTATSGPNIQDQMFFAIGKWVRQMGQAEPPR